jgi:hypothetical protein
VPGLNDLLRQYEANRFPPTRRLDLQGEGPDTARQRALQWIQSFAHEHPGSELLLVLERGRTTGPRGRGVRESVEKLVRQLEGGLLDWWQPFGPGSIAVRVADEPSMAPRSRSGAPAPQDEGRTRETAGAVLIAPDSDIPAEVLPLAQRAAELRRERESLSPGLLEVLLRRVWIEAQARAMAKRLDWKTAVEQVLAEEEARALDGG